MVRAGHLVLPSVLVAVAAGILAADAATVPVAVPLAIGAAVGVAGAAAGWHGAMLAGIACAAFGLGAWRGAATQSPAADQASVAGLVDGGEQIL